MENKKKTYEQILSEMGRPIDINSIPNRNIDLKGLLRYARSQGKRVIDLSMEERMKFVIKK